MASFVVKGGDASWASPNGGFTSSGAADYSWTANLEADEFDVTAFNASGITSKSWISGLRSVTGELRVRYAPATIGSGGLVTFASGYVVGAHQYALNLACDAFDVTQFNATPPTVKTFIPGLISWDGSYRCWYDDTTALAQVGGIASAAATFKIVEDGVSNDHTLAGNIFTKGAPATVNVGTPAEVEYAYRGDGVLTAAGTGGAAFPNPIFPVGAVTCAASTLTLTAATGRTLAFSAFWTRISLEVNVSQPIVLTIGFQGSGAVTIA